MAIERVVVTGGSGKAGLATVIDLQANGYGVVNVDVAASVQPDEALVVAACS